MNQSIVAKLIAKDLHFNRWLIGLGIGAGLASMALLGVHLFVGTIAFVTVVIVCYIFIALGTKRERVEKHALFILSLPVSPAQYTAAKVAAATLSFLILWGVLLSVGLLLQQFAAHPTDDGSVFLPLMLLLLVNFFVMLAVGVITTSELSTVAAIILTNTSVPLFFSLSQQVEQREADSAWAPTAPMLIVAAGAVITLCLALIAYTQSRRRDFV